MKKLKNNLAKGLGTNVIVGPDIANLIIDYIYNKCFLCKHNFLDDDLYMCWNKNGKKNMICCKLCIKKNNFKLCMVCQKFNEMNNPLDIYNLSKKFTNKPKLLDICDECLEERETYFYCKVLDVCCDIMNIINNNSN